MQRIPHLSIEHRTHVSGPGRHRRGLAPLELVLSLPILLFVMGLMILIGWASTFKVRTQIHAREAAWSSMWRANPRTDAQTRPNPPGFPPPARVSVDRGYVPCIQLPIGDLAAYDNHPVARGPVLTDPQSGRGLRVDPDLLDVRRGIITGQAEVTRGFPVLGEMPPGGYQHRVEFPVLDNKWQFCQKGLTSNSSRRSTRQFPDLSVRWQSVAIHHTMQFNQVAGQLRQSLGRRQMDLFDRDRTLAGFYGGYRDYYPNPPHRARTAARGDLSGFANSLISRIMGSPRPRSGLNDAGIPGAVTRDYLNMYRELARRARLNNRSDAAYIPLIQQLEAFEADLLQ